MIMAQDGILDVAVVGMPDMRLGEKICAYIKPKKGKTFSLTSLGSCLCSGALRSQALLFHSEWHDKAWSNLAHSIKTGESAFEKAYGKPAFEWLSENPEASARFPQQLIFGDMAILQNDLRRAGTPKPHLLFYLTSSEPGQTFGEDKRR